jgi:hypothetical protein
MSLSNLGNGTGLVYVTDSSSNIIQTVPNLSENIISIIGTGLTSAPISGEALANVTFTYASTGAGNIQIFTNVHGLIGTGVWAGSLSATLAALVVAIQGNVNGYSAVSTATTITVSAPAGTGTAGNSYIGTTSTAGLITVVGSNTITFSGGSSASGIYSTAFNGRRFFINASVSAVEGDLTGSTEITKDIVARMSTGSIYSQESVISSGTATIQRVSNISYAIIDTEAAAALDDLDSISTGGFSDGDIIQVSAKSTLRELRIPPSSINIELANNVEFLTNSTTSSIFLKYNATANKWYEIFRSPGLNLSTASQRSQGIPAAVPGTTTVVMPTSGTLNLTAGVDTGVQVVTGNPVMVANYAITPIGAPIDGDRFEIIWQATPTTGINTVTLFGKLLTAEQVQAKATILAVYNATQVAWDVTLITDGFSTTYATTTQLATKQDDLGFPGSNGFALFRDTIGVPYWAPIPSAITQFSQVVLTPAQVKSLAPVNLVPAQGANTITYLASPVMYALDYNTTPYDTNGEIQVIYTGTGTVLARTLNTWMTTASTTGFVGEATGFPGGVTAPSNTGIDFQLNGIASVAGDSNIVISFFYYVIAL